MGTTTHGGRSGGRHAVAATRRAGATTILTAVVLTAVVLTAVVLTAVVLTAVVLTAVVLTAVVLSAVKRRNPGRLVRPGREPAAQRAPRWR